MSGTALYRALLHAGAPESEAKEAAEQIDDMRVILSELRITNRLMAGLVIALLIKSFFYCVPRTPQHFLTSAAA
jgi:hypothetical protein